MIKLLSFVIIILAIVSPSRDAFTAEIKSEMEILREKMQTPENMALCKKAEDKRDFYLDMWKRQFYKRTNMEESYFSKHILYLQPYVFCQWYGEVIFKAIYFVRYEWATIERHDVFTVALYEQSNLHTGYPIKRNELLSEEEISYAIDHGLSGFLISPIKSFDSLLFSSREAAIKVLQSKLGQEIKDIEISLNKDGYPYLHGRVSGSDKLTYTTGDLNLVTGEVIVKKGRIIVD